MYTITAMDVYQTRRDNLQLLVGQHGGVVALAQKLERDSSQISRYIAWPAPNSRRIGETMASHIEKTLGLYPGWLSSLHSNNLPDHPLSHAVCAYLSHSPDPHLADILAALINAITPPRQ